MGLKGFPVNSMHRYNYLYSLEQKQVILLLQCYRLNWDIHSETIPGCSKPHPGNPVRRKALHTGIMKSLSVSCCCCWKHKTKKHSWHLPFLLLSGKNRPAGTLHAGSMNLLYRLIV